MVIRCLDTSVEISINDSIIVFKKELASINKFFMVILLIITLVFSLQTQTFGHFSLNIETAILIDRTIGSMLKKVMYPLSITKIV